MDSSSLVPTDPEGESANPKDQQHKTADTDREHGESRRQRRSQKGDILDRDECLRRIELLPGMLVAKLITPAIANSIRSTYKEIIYAHERTRTANSAQPTGDDIARVYSEQPALFKLLEPFLTDEQIDSIVREATNDEPG